MLHQAFSRRHTTPRLLAVLLALVGVLDLASALTPAMSARAQLLRELIGADPIRFSRTATVLAGLCALMLAQSLARRNRRAAHLAIALLLVSGLLNLLKGIDFEEAMLCFFVAWLLWRARRDFVVGGLPISWGKAVEHTVWFAGLSVLYAEFGALLLGRHVKVLATIGDTTHLMPFPLAAFLGLWTDSPCVAYYGPDAWWFHHSLHALALVGALYAVVRMLRPLISAKPATIDERRRARDLVLQFGTDTLSYFHLRADRSYIFAEDGNGFVSYVVRGDVALLGGDPVCAPESVRPLIRHALRTFAAHGLKACAIGVSARAMSAYRAEGMRALKLGEEALIDLRAFDRATLAKRVRRAARVIEAGGVTIVVGTMANLDPRLTAQFPAVSNDWLVAHGGSPQGFSMTSGPLPAPDDTGHHVVVAAAPSQNDVGSVLGFLTFAPVPAARVLSLDHMRRVSCAPNGLTEALVIRAAEYFRDQGYVALSLNFAALSDKECPDGEHAALRTARAAVFEGVRYLPLRSLYLFNKKFNPAWTSRYWMYPNAASLPATAYATMRAEVATAGALLPAGLGGLLRIR